MFTQTDLDNFYGTENYFFNPLFKNWRYTDGVKFVSDNGAAWLVTDILAHLMLNKKVKNEEFLAISFKVNPDKTGTLLFDDGNDKVLLRHDYDFTDLPFDLKFYATNNVLMLSSEY